MLCLPATFIGQISADVLSGCVPLTGVQFSNSYANPTGITWNFGDAASSNLPNPVHSFATAGTFNVTFNATVAGTPVSGSLQIQVFNIPTASFNVTSATGGCTGLLASFDDNSAGGGGVPIVNWGWAFGDGGTSSLSEPTYTYNLAGLFDVGLIVTDANGCVNSVTQTDVIAISLPPDIVITTNPNPPSVCNSPLLVTFNSTATSNSPLGNTLTYAWDFDNGQTSTLADPPAVTYTTIDNFNVQLTVTDDNDCSASENVQVSVAQPLADFTAVGAENDTVCSQVVFVNNSLGISPLYEYGDGLSGIINSHNYAAEGWYDVILTVESGTCSDDTTISIYVQIPTVTLNISPDTVCTFPGLYNVTAVTNVAVDTYDWVLPSGNSPDAASFIDTLEYNTTEYTVNVAVPFSPQVTITTLDGCTANDSENVVAVKPNALFFPDHDEGCAPLPVLFTNYSTTDIPYISQWQWHFGDASPTVNNLTDDAVTHTYLNEGIYNPFLVVVTNGGCRDTSWLQTIYVGVPPTPAFSVAPDLICPGDLVQITDLTSPADSVDTWNYSGDNGLLFSCETDQNPSVTFQSQTGVATITMTAGYNGCNATATQEINVNGPVGELSYSCNCDTPFNYPFSAATSDATSWDVTFGDGTSVLGVNTPAIPHTYASVGDYSVVLTSYNATSGCPASVDSLVVRVRDIEAILTLPDSLCAGVEYTFPATESLNTAALDGACFNSTTFFFGDDTQPKTTNSAYLHAYQSTGIFTAELWTEDINGCVDSTSKTVQVFGVDANFTFLTDGVCLPLTATFNNTSTSDLPINEYQWDFGDGSTSLAEDPVHVYTSPNLSITGTVIPYQITLTISDVLGCSVQHTATILPDVPDPTFHNLTPTTICAEEFVTMDPFASATGNTFIWNFGDGTTSAVYNPVHQFTDPGEYTISLTITNANGCSLSDTIVNYVSAQAYPIAGFSTTIEDGQTLCYPAQITFTDTSLVNPFGSRTWNLGNGSPTIGNTSIGANYDSPGSYTITLFEETTAGCSDTASLTISVEGPVGDFTLNPASICRGEDIDITITDTTDVLTWQWDFGDGTNEGALWTVNHEYDFEFNPASGQTLVSLVMWNNDSICNAVVTDNVSFITAVADFLRNLETTPLDTAHCVGTSDSFSNNSSASASQLNWDFGNGTTFNGPNPPAVTFQPGEYDVTLAISIAPQGCVDTVTKRMIIHALPQPVAIGGSICLGETFQLDGSGGEIYAWSPAEYLNDSTLENPSAFPLITTNYQLSVIDTNGCTNSTAAQVQVFQPLVPVDSTTILIIGESVVMNTDQGPGYIYSWTPDIWISCTDCPSPVFMPFADTSYTEIISDTLGCFTIESRYDFIVLQLASVDVPDAFTPNGDGVNDIIYVRGWGIESVEEFKIFNRWGEMVFQTTNAYEGWDGFYKGQLQQADTYSYIVSVKPYIQDIPLTLEGFINIIK